MSASLPERPSPDRPELASGKRERVDNDKQTLDVCDERADEAVDAAAEQKVKVSSSSRPTQAVHPEVSDKLLMMRVMLEKIQQHAFARTNASLLHHPSHITR